MLMKIRKNNLLTITVLTSATGHHMAVFGVYTYFLFLMTDKHFRLSYLHAINTLKLLLKKNANLRKEG